MPLKPIKSDATVLPPRNVDGQFRPARSSCCKSRVLKFDRIIQEYVACEGLVDPEPGEHLVCSRCNKALTME